MTLTARAHSDTQEMPYIYKYAKIQINHKQKQTQTAVVGLDILKRNQQFLG